MPTASPQQKRAALESHRELGRRLEAIQNALKGGSDRNAKLEALLASSFQHWEVLSEYLSATVQPRYYNEFIPPQSTAAQRTFAIPELFNMITDRLTVPDILALASTCKEFKAYIDDSRHMRVALCLQPAPAEARFHGRFKTCLAHFPGGGFYCKPPVLRSYAVKKSEDGESRHVEIQAGFFPQGEDQRLPRIGPTWRRMFVTQPPVKEMTARVRCCGDIRVTIEREEGIRIGDLYDTNKKYIEEHRWCPHEAHGSRMLENGQVQVLVDFTARVTLRASDPMITEFEKTQAEKESDDKKSSAIRRRNSMYRSAKVVARDQGLPIPTLSEWLEANPLWKMDHNGDILAQQPQTEIDQAQMISIDAFSFN